MSVVDVYDTAIAIHGNGKICKDILVGEEAKLDQGMTVKVIRSFVESSYVPDVNIYTKFKQPAWKFLISVV